MQYLPPDIQQIVLNPPSLSSPQSFFPLIRAVFPWAKVIIVILALYIVWSFVASLFGFVSRIFRFSMKVGPVLGLIGWLMANSGQGSMPELFEAAKQYAGFGSPAGTAAAGGGGGGNWSPGIANLFGLGNNNNAGTKSKYGSRARADPVGSRTRAGKRKAAAAGSGVEGVAGDLLNSMLGSETGQQAAAALQDGDWQGVVQDYVKNAMAKAAGLDWLMGGSSETAEQKKAKGKSR